MQVRRRFKKRTPRFRKWDYASPGAYFITINTYKRNKYFGKLSEGELLLTEVGKVAIYEWLKTPGIRPELNLGIDEYCVMPDHFHAILIIGENETNSIPEYPNKFGPQSNNLASIIRGYKSAVTTYARKHNLKFAWQPRYYVKILESESALDEVRKYIRNNPGTK